MWSISFADADFLSSFSFLSMIFQLLVTLLQQGDNWRALAAVTCKWQRLSIDLKIVFYLFLKQKKMQNADIISLNLLLKMNNTCNLVSYKFILILYVNVYQMVCKKFKFFFFFIPLRISNFYSCLIILKIQIVVKHLKNACT